MVNDIAARLASLDTASSTVLSVSRRIAAPPVRRPPKEVVKDLLVSDRTKSRPGKLEVKSPDAVKWQYVNSAGESYFERGIEGLLDWLHAKNRSYITEQEAMDFCVLNDEYAPSSENDRYEKLLSELREDGEDGIPDLGFHAVSKAVVNDDDDDGATVGDPDSPGFEFPKTEGHRAVSGIKKKSRDEIRRKYVDPETGGFLFDEGVEGLAKWLAIQGENSVSQEEIEDFLTIYSNYPWMDDEYSSFWKSDGKPPSPHSANPEDRAAIDRIKKAGRDVNQTLMAMNDKKYRRKPVPGKVSRGPRMNELEGGRPLSPRGNLIEDLKKANLQVKAVPSGHKFSPELKKIKNPLEEFDLSETSEPEQRGEFPKGRERQSPEDLERAALEKTKSRRDDILLGPYMKNEKGQFLQDRYGEKKRDEKAARPELASVDAFAKWLTERGRDSYTDEEMSLLVEVTGDSLKNLGDKLNGKGKHAVVKGGGKLENEGVWAADQIVEMAVERLKSYQPDVTPDDVKELIRAFKPEDRSKLVDSSILVNSYKKHRPSLEMKKAVALLKRRYPDPDLAGEFTKDNLAQYRGDAAHHVSAEEIAREWIESNMGESEANEFDADVSVDKTQVDIERGRTKQKNLDIKVEDGWSPSDFADANDGKKNMPANRIPTDILNQMFPGRDPEELVGATVDVTNGTVVLHVGNLSVGWNKSNSWGPVDFAAANNGVRNISVGNVPKDILDKMFPGLDPMELVGAKIDVTNGNVILNHRDGGSISWSNESKMSDDLAFLTKNVGNRNIPVKDFPPGLFKKAFPKVDQDGVTGSMSVTKDAGKFTVRLRVKDGNTYTWQTEM